MDDDPAAAGGAAVLVALAVLALAIPVLLWWQSTMPRPGTWAVGLLACLAVETLAVWWELRRWSPRPGRAALAQAVLLVPILAWGTWQSALEPVVPYELAFGVCVVLAPLVVFLTGALAAGGRHDVALRAQLPPIALVAVAGALALWVARDPLELWGGAFVGADPLCLSAHDCTVESLGVQRGVAWAEWAGCLLGVVAGLAWWWHTVHRHPRPPMRSRSVLVRVGKAVLVVAGLLLGAAGVVLLGEPAGASCLAAIVVIAVFVFGTELEKDAPSVEARATPSS